MIFTQNIFLIGPMGSGKTTVGQILAKELKFKFYDVDKEIEKQTGADIPWIFDVEGEVGFRKHEEKAIAQLTTCSSIVLATGGGSILSAHNRSMLSARGFVIYLHVSIEQQLARIGHAKDRPLLIGQKDPYQTLVALQEQREPLYREIADYIVETDQLIPRAIAKNILAKLHEPLVNPED